MSTTELHCYPSFTMLSVGFIWEQADDLGSQRSHQAILWMETEQMHYLINFLTKV